MDEERTTLVELREVIDSVNAKVALIAWCRRRKIPVITTGGAGGQIDPTQITVADLSKTVNDPLAAKARSLLRRDHNFPRADSKRSFGVPCVYSKEQLRYPKPDGSVCTQKSFVGEGVRLDCSGGFGACRGRIRATRAVRRRGVLHSALDELTEEGELLEVLRLGADLGLGRARTRAGLASGLGLGSDLGSGLRLGSGSGSGLG